eukprot:scaffold310_cov335-Pavlova_lutheri.AAC.64
MSNPKRRSFVERASRSPLASGGLALKVMNYSCGKHACLTPKSPCSSCPSPSDSIKRISRPWAKARKPCSEKGMKPKRAPLVCFLDEKEDKVRLITIRYDATTS